MARGRIGQWLLLPSRRYLLLSRRRLHRARRTIRSDSGCCNIGRRRMDSSRQHPESTSSGYQDISPIDEMISIRLRLLRLESLMLSIMAAIALTHKYARESASQYHQAKGPSQNTVSRGFLQFPCLEWHISGASKVLKPQRRKLVMNTMIINWRIGRLLKPRISHAEARRKVGNFDLSFDLQSIGGVDKPRRLFTAASQGIHCAPYPGGAKVA